MSGLLDRAGREAGRPPTGAVFDLPAAASKRSVASGDGEAPRKHAGNHAGDKGGAVRPRWRRNSAGGDTGEQVLAAVKSEDFHDLMTGLGFRKVRKWIDDGYVDAWVGPTP